MKLEELKSAIKQLYENEGKSISYIAKLFDLNRSELSNQLEIWDFIRGKQQYIKPSRRKYLNKNKQIIINMLKENKSLEEISNNINSDKIELKSYIFSDKQLNQLYKEYLSRLNKKDKAITNSNITYAVQDLDGEIWKQISEYPNYYVSNKGRIKKYFKSYDKYSLLKPEESKNNKRLYISLYNESGRKVAQISRLVGFAFVSGYSKINNTINHKDGDVQNNSSDNLEWVSQSENERHAYGTLHRKINKRVSKKVTYIYKDKYEFKTIAALSRFMKKSKTQIRRYLENPEKYDIKIIAEN